MKLLIFILPIILFSCAAPRKVISTEKLDGGVSAVTYEQKSDIRVCFSKDFLVIDDEINRFCKRKK